jgi:hypothetical protein
VILRRRDDLAMVMRELGGSLFAVEGEVDRWFEESQLCRMCGASLNAVGVKEENRFCEKCWPNAFRWELLKLDPISEADVIGIKKGPSDDLAMIVREQCDERFEDERGQVFLCEKPKSHTGTHESGDMEWWDNPLLNYEVHLAEQKRLKQQADERVHINTDRSPAPVVAMFRLWLLRESVERHIREGPQREAAALRKARALKALAR